MTVSGLNLVSSSNNTAGTSFTTSSISPTANSLVLLSFLVRNAVSVDPVTPTVTGAGLTWVEVNSSLYDPDSSTRRKLFVFRALGASPSTGALTIDFGAVTHTNITYAIDEFSGVDTSGTNGSGAIVQSGHNEVTDGTVSTLTVTLSAFSNLGNATFGAFAANNDSNTTTAGTGFTKLGDVLDSGRLMTEFRSDNDTTVNFTLSTASDLGGVAIEIKPAPLTTSWTVSAQIKADNTKVSGASDLTNFPVLIKDGNIPASVYSAMQSAGQDLRITTDSAGTTEIPFEIVSITPASGLAEVWAKIPTLYTASDTSLYCYSPDTDILTSDGWINIKDYVEEKLDIPLATLNPDKQIVEYHKPLQLIKKRHVGKMLHQTGKGIDFLVTPNHRVWTKRNASDKYELIEASKVPANTEYQKYFPYSGKKQSQILIEGFRKDYETKACIQKFFGGVVGNRSAYINHRIFADKYLPTNKFLRLLGIFLSEGSLRKSSVAIAQQKVESRKKMIEWVKDLGYKPTLTPADILINDVQLVEWFKKFGHAKDKYIPKEIKQLDKSHLKYLLEGLLLGDGTVRRGGIGDSTCYYSISRRLIDDVQEIAVKCGYSTSIKTVTSGFGSRVMVLGINKGKYSSPYNPGKKNANWIDYDGDVYCVGVQNHIVYTRRNGSACWNGNCWSGNASAIAYDANAPFGSQAVWSDYAAVYHLTSMTADSTAGGYTLTNNGTTASGTGQIGTGADGGATNSTKYLSISSALGLSGGAAAKTLSVWLKMNTELSGANSYAASVALTNADIDTDFRIGYWRETTNRVAFNRGKNGVGTTPIYSVADLGTTNFYKLAMGWDGTTLEGFKNGASVGTDTPSGAGNNGFTDTLSILSDNGGAWPLSAIVDEVRIRKSRITSDWEATEYANQNSPSTFWSEVVASSVRHLSLLGCGT